MLNTSCATEIFSRLQSHCQMERDMRAGESKGLAMVGPQVTLGVQVRKEVMQWLNHPGSGSPVPDLH